MEVTIVKLSVRKRMHGIGTNEKIDDFYFVFLGVWEIYKYCIMRILVELNIRRCSHKKRAKKK